jgi:hypothetical protein
VRSQDNHWMTVCRFKRGSPVFGLELGLGIGLGKGRKNGASFLKSINL